MRRELDAVPRDRAPSRACASTSSSHQLLHQVTYDSVLKRHKREQHRLMAEWLVAGAESAPASTRDDRPSTSSAPATPPSVAYLQARRRGRRSRLCQRGRLDYLGRALALAPEPIQQQRFELLLTPRRRARNTGQRAEQEADRPLWSTWPRR